MTNSKQLYNNRPSLKGILKLARRIGISAGKVVIFIRLVLYTLVQMAAAGFSWANVGISVLVALPSEKTKIWKKLAVWFYILFFFGLSTVSGQIQPMKAFPIPADEFIIYKEHHDSIRQLDFQIGCYEPKDTLSLQMLHNKANGARTEIGQKDRHIYYVHAPIYLKIRHQDSEICYFLNDYYDPDMYGFQDSISDKLLLITARYHIYLFDYEKQTLSNKLVPGLGQYEGEDAISGLYSALTVFDNAKFLLGNAQAFGIFCFDISNPAKPVELKQHQIPSEEHTAFYAFLSPKEKQQFDVLMACVDPKSVSRLITRFYRKLEIIRYAARNIYIANNAEGLPDIRTVGDCLIIRSEDGIRKVNLATGTYSR